MLGFALPWIDDIYYAYRPDAENDVHAIDVMCTKC